MLKKISLLALAITLSINILAQQKEFNKIKALYEASNYEKCIEKSQKVSKKYKKEATPYYYIAMCSFQQYKTEKGLKKNHHLKNTISNLNFGLKKDKTQTTFKSFSPTMQEIHDSILSYADKLWIEDKGKSEYYYENLVKIYQDTTKQYLEIFTKPTQVITQNLAFASNRGPINQKDMTGNKQGLWIQKYENGLVKSEINFKDNHPAGIFRKYYPNGNLKANMFFDKTGTKAASILYNEDGSKKACGYYINKQKDSLWQYFINDSIVLAEENYKNGLKHGKQRIFNLYAYPNLLNENFWKNGKEDSTWTEFHVNGKVKSTTIYKNGKRNGRFTAYNENGKILVSGVYVNGRKNGTWKDWNPEDKKYIKTEFVNGVAKNHKELLEKEQIEHKKMQDNKGKIPEPKIETLNLDY